MSRSIKKGPYVHPSLAKKGERAQRSDTKVVILTGWASSIRQIKTSVGTLF